MALMRKMIFKAAVSLLITAIFAVIFAAPVRKQRNKITVPKL